MTNSIKIRDLTIGQLAAEAGCKVQTIRYYEENGILPKPIRTMGNQRRYSDKTVAILRFVRHARDLGFSLDDIRQFIALSDREEESCEKVDHIARDHLAEVRRRISMLKGLERELVRMTTSGKHGTVADCRVIETLADHGKCSGSH